MEDYMHEFGCLSEEKTSFVILMYEEYKHFCCCSVQEVGSVIIRKMNCDKKDVADITQFLNCKNIEDIIGKIISIPSELIADNSNVISLMALLAQDKGTLPEK